MAKILITTTQVDLVPTPSETWRRQHKLLLLKYLPLNYHHSHFLAATFDFTSLACLEAEPLDINSFCNFIPKASLWPALGVSFNLSFTLPQREDYYEEDFNDCLATCMFRE